MKTTLTNQRKIEILRKVLEEFINDKFNTSRGICYHIIPLLTFSVEFNEIDEFKKWFDNQKPRPRVNYSFTKNSSFTNGIWWWTKNENGRDQRILFLNHLINNLTK